MTLQTTFYLSQILGKNFISPQAAVLGKIKDLLIDLSAQIFTETEPIRPKVISVKVQIGEDLKIYDFSSFQIIKAGNDLTITCYEVNEITDESQPNSLWLKENILDKQIVDITGRKLVRVNDVRLVLIPSGTYALAVDVGIEGLLRRIGIDRPIQKFLDPFKLGIPGKMILWDDIQAVDFSNANIKLSKPYAKLNTLHPSDLADIIEEMDKATRATVFAMLDEEQAADVLEEMEPHAQIHLVESLPVEKMADVLEKMPADEVADLLDGLEEERAEKLLNEMDKESSEEVRELLEYPDQVVGSIMTTDFLTFGEEMTVDEVLNAIRKEKPEPSYIYSIFVVDKKNKLISSIPLGEMVISEPHMKLKQIMDKDFISVYDDNDIDILADLVSKYNLLAVPVINKEKELEGVVVVEDIVEDLLKSRKTK